MSVKYSEASQVEHVAQDVIRDHHPHLIGNAVKVLYLFTDKAEKVKGKVALGTARKVSGLNAYLARRDDNDWDDSPDFFLVCVWQEWWRSRSTTDEQRRALVDHELCHCFSEAEENDSGEPTGRIKLSVLPHDITEFNAIASRHGAWQPDIEDFLAAMRGDDEDAAQPRLLDIGDQPGARAEAASAIVGAAAAEGQTITVRHKGQSVTMTPEQAARRYEELEARARKRGAG